MRNYFRRCIVIKGFTAPVISFQFSSMRPKLAIRIFGEFSPAGEPERQKKEYEKVESSRIHPSWDLT